MTKSKDTCLFCGDAPCTCKAKPKRATKMKVEPTVKVTEEPPLPPRNSNHLAAMQKAAMKAPSKPMSSSRHRMVEKPKSDQQIAWEAAIRNLGPLLAQEEREKYGAIISSPPHPDEDKIMWKMRRNSDNSD